VKNKTRDKIVMLPITIIVGMYKTAGRIAFPIIRLYEAAIGVKPGDRFSKSDFR